MRKPMLVNCSTYGWYYPKTSIFECTHGGWDGEVEFIDDSTCTINTVNGLCAYKWIDKIPEEYGGERDNG